MIKLLKSNIPLVYTTSILFVLVGGINVFIEKSSFQNGFFVWYSSMMKFVQTQTVINYTISSIVLLITGFILNRAFNKTSFYLKNTALPIFIFLVILSTFGGFYFENAYIISLVFALAFLKIIELDQNRTAIHIVFTAGLIIGFGFLFSYWILFISILLFFSLNTFRPFHWREWLVSILGMALPMLYLLSFRYLMYNSVRIEPQLIQPDLKVYHWFDYLSYGILLLITLIALVKLRNQFKYILNIERKQVNILVFFMVISFSISVIVYWLYRVEYLIFIVPLTLLLSIPILNTKHDGILNTLFITLVILNLLRIFVF